MSNFYNNMVKVGINSEKKIVTEKETISTKLRKTNILK